MSQNTNRVLFLGHSFTWRLERFIQNCTSLHIQKDFGLPSSTPLKFHGNGGRTVDSLRRHDWPIVEEFQPTILILDIGSNDLPNPRIPVVLIANNILALIRDLHFKLRVGHIVLGEILPRQPPQAFLSNLNYLTLLLNQLLLAGLKPLPFATLWFHKAITEHRHWVFLDDGVHLNRAGNCLLYFSYKHALKHCQRRLARRATNRRHFFSRRRTCAPPTRDVRTLPY